eukprot:6319057-Amphidinium_carterae.1
MMLLILKVLNVSCSFALSIKALDLLRSNVIPCAITDHTESGDSFGSRKPARASRQLVPMEVNFDS